MQKLASGSYYSHANLSVVGSCFTVNYYCQAKTNAKYQAIFEWWDRSIKR